MRNLALLIPILFLSSCATIIHKKDYDVNITSDLPNATVEIQDSVYHLPANFKIKRSRQDLHIKLVCDTLEKNYLVKAYPNSPFLYGNLFFTWFAPIGYLVDYVNQKGFNYGKNIHLRSYDTAGIIRTPFHNYWAKTYPGNQGQLNFSISLPWVNNFYFQPQYEPIKNNTGFWGLSAGFDYYYKDSRFLALAGSAVMDLFIPVPAAIDMLEDYEIMTSAYVSLTDNNKIGRFTFGYGISYSWNTWRHVYIEGYDSIPSPTREPLDRSNNSIGFAFDVYHQFGESFYIGLIYRPSFLIISPTTELKYEHLISMDFKWRIRIIE